MVENSTVINDPVHGHIELDPLYMRIIDTPQFQRLRFVKQLGSTYFVFPGAVHTRFEHSIGVCHLAETLCKILKEKQPELGITKDDVHCVAIAGLCHDLGHGPFSHMFDSSFMPKFNKNWKHEEGSVSMFDYLIKDNNLEGEFKEEDLTFIREQINPKRVKDQPYEGRNQDKSFLYEIVANKRNGIDVDKWDYIARDCYYLGIRTAFDHNRLMKFVRVLQVNGERQICTRAKEVDNLYELFHSRMCLHRQAYLHKTGLIIDCMISCALEKANDHLLFEDSEGRKHKMSESVHHMSAYVKLTDNVFQFILSSDDPNLSDSKKLLSRIIERKLPKIVGRFKFDPDKWTEKLIKDKVIEARNKRNYPLKNEDLIIIKRKFDYGMGAKNPMDHCWFYNKHNLSQPYQVKREQVSSFLPSKFAEVQFLFFVDDASKIAPAQECYKMVCSEYELDVSMGAEQSGMVLTPLKLSEFEPESPKRKRAKKYLSKIYEES